LSLTAIKQGSCRAPFKGLLIVCSLGLMVAGCSSTSSQTASVAEQQGPERVTTGSHKVNQGDTLWSIAFRFGWDWKELAQLNGIQPPYMIYPGQVIRFDSGPVIAPVAVAPPVVAQPASKTSGKNRKPTTNTRPVAPVTAAVVPAAVAPVSLATPTPSAASSADWAWPAKGDIISRFSSNGSLNKGIDIAGQLGQPVLAAAEGTVVYAGSGLRGYGELVIIKHNDTFVSAYGHNQRLLVREGQQVKIGQTIAEMGSTGTDRVKLHFEIRRQGKPTDPLQYLPNR